MKRSISITRVQFLNLHVLYIHIMNFACVGYINSYPQLDVRFDDEWRSMNCDMGYDDDDTHISYIKSN